MVHCRGIEGRGLLSRPCDEGVVVQALMQGRAEGRLELINGDTKQAPPPRSASFSLLSKPHVCAAALCVVPLGGDDLVPVRVVAMQVLLDGDAGAARFTW